MRNRTEILRVIKTLAKMALTVLAAILLARWLEISTLWTIARLLLAKVLFRLIYGIACIIVTVGIVVALLCVVIL